MPEPGGRGLVASFLGLTVLAGCGTAAVAPSAGGSPAISGTVTVLAAASLTEAFTDLADDFQRRHPGTRVQVSFGGSPALVAQVEQGSPADVIATADQKNMDRLAGEALLDGASAVFATNTLEIAVQPGNPAGVHGLADLARANLRVALCAPAVPCGGNADTALARAGVAVQAATLDPDVKTVLSHVELGSADAGIVYATDVSSAGARVTGVPIPAAVNVRNAYPVALVKRAAESAAARAFRDYILSADGQALLRRHGFGGAAGWSGYSASP